MAATNVIQLEGNCSLGPVGGPVVDYSEYVESMVINTSRTSVTLPPVLANARESEAAGPKKETITIKFRSGTDAASVWGMLYEAINTDTSEVDFSGTFNAGEISADNPEYSGTAVLLSLDTGVDVGDLREQTITLPVTADGLTVNITPAP